MSYNRDKNKTFKRFFELYKLIEHLQKKIVSFQTRTGDRLCVRQT